VKIGITCYPSVGGSGIVATEIGNELAERGHSVHFICSDEPWRFDPSKTKFHKVRLLEYPLFQHDIYVLALASKMAEVITQEALDVLHVHYAVPHATAALLAKQITGARTKIVTTLHGTDITLIGRDPSLLSITKYSIEQSDGITAVSAFLRQATCDAIGVTKPIEVIGNFVDSKRFKPSSTHAQTLVHHSNFRALKRVDDVIRVFEQVQTPCTLLLIGDGPERPKIEAMVKAAGLDTRVRFLGEVRQIENEIATARVALFPSESEAFGLAALETMSAGVPVVATRVGGLPEVVQDGGVLCALGDIGAMAAAVTKLLTDDVYYERLAARARAIAVEQFQPARQIAHYEAFYAAVLADTPRAPGLDSLRPA
jgi:N-acetyl-alpha-D-glucosaminyl L-malate synthase BshA